jgi:hypothetical protein
MWNGWERNTGEMRKGDKGVTRIKKCKKESDD